MHVKNISIRKFFFLPFLLALISCSNEKSWNFSDGVKFPEGTQLSRAEDGVILSNGTLVVADQRYGLAKIDLAGNVTHLVISKHWIMSTILLKLNLDPMEFISLQTTNISSQLMFLMERFIRHQ